MQACLSAFSVESMSLSMLPARHCLAVVFRFWYSLPKENYWEVSTDGCWPATGLWTLALRDGILFWGGGVGSSLNVCPLKQLHLGTFLDMFLASTETPAETKEK